MRRVALGFVLGAMLILAAPGGAASGSSVRASLRIGVPIGGDVTVAESRFKIRNIRRNIKFPPAPRLSVLNKSQLGSNVVVVASVAREAKDRNRFDITVAVVARAGATASGDALLVVDEPTVATTAQTSFTLTTIATTNVVQGNNLPKYAFPCGFGHASFLSGDHSGLPTAQWTLLFSCGFALDQAWMPLSFASEIGAHWCDGLIGTPAAGSMTYPAGFGCNDPINAFAVQDPKKSTGVTGLQLFPPLVGTCKAPFQQLYIGLCTLTTPLAANTPGPFTMTLASPLPSGGEFGFTALSGGTQRNYPMREIDTSAAVTMLTSLIDKYPDFARLAAAKEDLMNNKVAHACEVLLDLLDAESQLSEPRPIVTAIGQGLNPVFKALDCFSR